MNRDLSRRRAAALLSLVLVAACSREPGVPSPVVADSLRIREDVTHLAADALEGRGSGTAGNDSAAAYAAARFRSLGLDSLGLAGYLQPFQVRPPRGHAADPHAALQGEPRRTQNIVAMLPGSDAALRDQYIVIGAHIDHLGRGTEGALDPDAGSAIRNGADDNASGTAAVLELARIFSRRPAARSLVFVLFSGEELGLLGSSHFVNAPPLPLDRATAMVNFDMVGRLRDGKLIVYGVETAAEMRAIVDAANADSALAIHGVGDGYGPSDHASFYGKGIPVLHLFTDLHDDYHRASDDVDKINFGGIARIVGYAERVVRDIGDRPARLTVHQVAAPAPRAAGSGTGVYLGTIPDMGSNVKGMRLTGVRAGSPADKGGIKAGDVIVRFGGREVTDIYTYTDAMNAHKPDDVVEIEVIRDGQPVKVTVTMGRRP